MRKQISNWLQAKVLSVTRINEERLEAVVRSHERPSLVFTVIMGVHLHETIADIFGKHRRNNGRRRRSFVKNNMLAPFHETVVYKEEDCGEHKDHRHRKGNNDRSFCVISVVVGLRRIDSQR